MCYPIEQVPLDTLALISLPEGKSTEFEIDCEFILFSLPIEGGIGIDSDNWVDRTFTIRFEKGITDTQEQALDALKDKGTITKYSTRHP